jgi:hypothetical protein
LWAETIFFGSDFCFHKFPAPEHELATASPLEHELFKIKNEYIFLRILCINIFLSW